MLGSPSQLVQALQAGIEEWHRLCQEPHHWRAAAHGEVHQIARHETGFSMAVPFGHQTLVQRCAVDVLGAVTKVVIDGIQCLDLAPQLLCSILVQHHARQLGHLLARTVGLLLGAELDHASGGQHRGIDLRITGCQSPSLGKVGSWVVAQVGHRHRGDKIAHQVADLECRVHRHPQRQPLLGLGQRLHQGAGLVVQRADRLQQVGVFHHPVLSHPIAHHLRCAFGVAGHLVGHRHLLSSVHGGQCCAVAGRCGVQVAPVEQHVLQQVGIELLRAALEFLPGLLVGQTLGEAGPLQAALFLHQAVERHIGLVTHQLVGILVNQPRLLGHAQHTLVEAVELGQGLGIRLLAAAAVRHLPIIERLQAGDVLITEQVFLALGLEVFCALGGHVHQESVVLTLQAGQHLGKAALLHVHIRHAIAQERAAVQQRCLQGSVAALGHTRQHVGVLVQLGNWGELVDQRLLHAQAQVGLEAVKALAQGRHFVIPGHGQVSTFLVGRQATHAGSDGVCRLGAAELGLPWQGIIDSIRLCGYISSLQALSGAVFAWQLEPC